MDFLTNKRLDLTSVRNLLERFDNAFTPPLHLGLDFEQYSTKLSENAHFILAEQDNQPIGFIAYYLNEEGKFIYVPFTAVHPTGRHKHIGHTMFSYLKGLLGDSYQFIRLEVLKNNVNARRFYEREGFCISEDRGEKFLLTFQGSSDNK